MSKCLYISFFSFQQLVVENTYVYIISLCIVIPQYFAGTQKLDFL